MDTPRENLPTDRPVTGRLRLHCDYGPRPVIVGPRRPQALCVWAGRTGIGPWIVF
jgi:hypothetical protein